MMYEYENVVWMLMKQEVYANIKLFDSLSSLPTTSFEISTKCWVLV